MPPSRVEQLSCTRASARTTAAWTSASRACCAARRARACRQEHEGETSPSERRERCAHAQGCQDREATRITRASHTRLLLGAIAPTRSSRAWATRRSPSGPSSSSCYGQRAGSHVGALPGTRSRDLTRGAAAKACAQSRGDTLSGAEAQAIERARRAPGGGEGVTSNFGCTRNKSSRRARLSTCVHGRALAHARSLAARSAATAPLAPRGRDALAHLADEPDEEGGRHGRLLA
jgi:hypothetical protein